MVAERVLDGPGAPEVIFGLHVFPIETAALYYRPRGALATAAHGGRTDCWCQNHGRARYDVRGA